jgi:hypothetical protein
MYEEGAETENAKAAPVIFSISVHLSVFIPGLFSFLKDNRRSRTLTGILGHANIKVKRSDMSIP